MINQLGIIPTWQKQHQLSELCLKKDELHLWWLPLHLEDEQKEFTYSLLNQRQLDKYHRRAHPQLQSAYLAGRYYLLTLLGAYKKCKPAEIKLNYSRLNKPSLDMGSPVREAEAIEFNFTDTTANNQSYGLFAFCLNNSVGVDIEAMSRTSNFSKIANRRFTEQELAYVKEASGELNPQKCLAIWTRKEAYGKATGKGINFQMNERNLISAEDHEYHFNDEQKDWRLLQIQPEKDFIACVVHETHQPLSIKAFKLL